MNVKSRKVKEIQQPQPEPEREQEPEPEPQVEIKKKVSKKKVQENYIYKIAELDDEYDLLTRLDMDGNFKMQKKINKDRYNQLFNEKQLILSKPAARGANKENIIVKDKEFKINYSNIPNKKILVQFSTLFNNYLTSINAPSSLSEIAVEEIVKSLDTL